MKIFNSTQIHGFKNSVFSGSILLLSTLPIICSLSWSIIKLHLVSTSLTIPILNVRKNGLSVIQILRMSLTWIGILLGFPEFFVKESNELNFHFFIDIFKCHGFVKSLFQFFSLSFYEYILFLDFLLNSTHVPLYVVDVINSLLGRLYHNIVENFENLHVFFFHFLDLHGHFLIFTFEFK